MKLRIAVVGMVLYCAVGSASAGAVIYDLTGGAVGPPLVEVSATINGAIFTAPAPQEVTGSGVWGPFLRLNNDTPNVATNCDPAAKQTCEQGYNTSDRASGNPKVQYDEKTDLTFTHDLNLFDVPLITFKGIQYLEFALDINEPSTPNNDKANLLSLDQLQLFVGANLDTSTFPYTNDAGNGNLGSLTALYSLDAGGDNAVLLDYNVVGSGSGRPDLVVLIPYSIITPDIKSINGGNPFIYLFSRFGDQVGPPPAFADSGYEEWAAVEGSLTCPPGSTDPDCKGPPAQIPEPQSLMLIGLGLLGLALMRRRARV